MQTSSVLPGVFYTILIAGGVLAFPVSVLLINRYKKALIKGMGYKSTEFSGKTDNYSDADAFSGRLKLNIIPVKNLPEDSSAVFKKLKETLGYHWFAYGAMILVFASILATSALIPNQLMTARRMIYCTLIFSFVYVHISGMLVSNGWKQKVAMLSIVFFMYFGLIYIVWDSVSTKEMSFFTSLAPVIIYNIAPTLIIAVFRINKIKAVGMFVLSFLIISVSGPALLSFYLTTHPQVLDYTGRIFVNMGMSASATLLLWTLISLTMTLIVGWFFIRQIKTWYTRKWINDIQLTADAYVLLFNITYSIFIFFDSPKYALISLVAFPAYKLTGFLLFYLLRKRRIKKVSPRLLLLRVFALGDDSKKLFERILKHWRYAGSIQMISGPDLATTTVEPHEIISFVSGNLKDSFCESEDSIKLNIAKLDNEPDLDGTHRVNELFCRDNNWKYVLNKLVTLSDIILMDLRRFSPDFKGCRYEIEALMHLVPMSRILFIIDKDTSTDYLSQVFAQAAQSSSVNDTIIQTGINVYFIENEKDSEVSKVLNLVCSKIDTY